jgi:hypothetical protein
MKKLGLIIFGIIAVTIAAILAFVVMIETQPRVKMTIQAIRPTGKFVTGTNLNGTVMTGQYWEFGITNVGRARARWLADVSAYQLNLREISYPRTFYILADGRLMPGEGVVTNMIVPVGDKPEWYGVLDFFPDATPFQQRLWILALKTPYLKYRVIRFYNRGEATTPCRTTTDAPTAPFTVTNTPWGR